MTDTRDDLLHTMMATSAEVIAAALNAARELDPEITDKLATLVNRGTPVRIELVPARPMLTVSLVLPDGEPPLMLAALDGGSTDEVQH